MKDWANFAVVYEPVQSASYLVLTHIDVKKASKFGETLRNNYAKLPGSPRLGEISMFTRRWQRLFGWGDVCDPSIGHGPAVVVGTQQHPEQPSPFWVVDYIKWPVQDKVVWITQEIGRDAGLPTFASKFMELFRGSINDKGQQKVKCLQCFALYNPSAGKDLTKNSDLSPAVQEVFDRVWNSSAPQLCLECGKPSPGMYHAECENMGKMIVCKKCTKPAVLLEDGSRICPSCTPASLQTPVSHDSSEAVRGNDKLLRKMHSAMEFRAAVDPNHEPAWKMRKKS
jgi:hypothetical protein